MVAVNQFQLQDEILDFFKGVSFNKLKFQYTIGNYFKFNALNEIS